ncbi:2OG-Fe dioxygenase family protein [Pseudomonas sp. SWRI81]|uniref:2OG-Fe dioxygenase family protein n=1 Tax=Pseudomonas sp. SWRI81 TaxID=2745505 RepID=UPI001644DF78|nr:2OG-Fe dioxygenase family protein [Pseudomonas sp. SWRI81]MBC3272858.1 2OG-Fe dioxygenase family protein [Pseudomonas sp. SWRI81]
MSAGHALRHSGDAVLKELAGRLSHHHYVHSDQYPAAQVARLGRGDCRAFNATWERLPRDGYLHAQNGVRERRICKFEYRHRAHQWTPLPDCHFFQAQAHNPLLGGVQRTYTRSEAAFIDSAVLRTLLAADLALMELTVGPRDWLVTCHQFRILCDERNAGHATPEGRHRDGHDFVFQHLIQRQQVTGGESRIFAEEGDCVFSATLTDYMETVVLNDRILLHEVSPLQTSGMHSDRGSRDMLIIDFDLADY